MLKLDAIYFQSDIETIYKTVGGYSMRSSNDMGDDRDFKSKEEVIDYLNDKIQRLEQIKDQVNNLE